MRPAVGFSQVRGEEELLKGMNLEARRRNSEGWNAWEVEKGMCVPRISGFWVIDGVAKSLRGSQIHPFSCVSGAPGKSCGKFSEKPLRGGRS